MMPAILLEVIGAFVAIFIIIVAYYVLAPVIIQSFGNINGVAEGLHLSQSQYNVLSTLESNGVYMFGTALVVMVIMLIIYMLIAAQRQEPDTGWVPVEQLRRIFGRLFTMKPAPAVSYNIIMILIVLFAFAVFYIVLGEPFSFFQNYALSQPPSTYNAGYLQFYNTVWRYLPFVVLLALVIYGFTAAQKRDMP